MTYFHVALCGSLGVGKATMLARYAEAAGTRPEQELIAGHAVLHLPMPEHGVCLHTAPEMMDDIPHIVPHLLAQVDALVYVVTPEADRRSRYVADLRAFHDMAVPLGCDWPEIPWILCLNRMDQGHDFRILESFPRPVRNHAICTHAIRGQGLDTLFDHLIGSSAA